MDFWLNVIENSIGNAISDVIIGTLIALYIPLFISRTSERRGQTATLSMLDVELQLIGFKLNDILSDLFPPFERQHKQDKGNFDNSALQEFHGVLREAVLDLPEKSFSSLYPNIGRIDNTQVIEKILNFYNVTIESRLKHSVNIRAINSDMYWTYKRAIKETSSELAALRNAISDEMTCIRETKSWKAHNTHRPSSANETASINP